MLVKQLQFLNILTSRLWSLLVIINNKDFTYKNIMIYDILFHFFHIVLF
jgi:hypothetical protein